MHQCHGQQKAATPGVQECNSNSEVADTEHAQPPLTDEGVRSWPVERVKLVQ